MSVSYFFLPGFDKWCRISSGLSNAQIAEAVGVRDQDVSGWRAGEGMTDPSATLAGLRASLIATWPPATAEQAWQELLQVIAGARPASEAPAPRAQVEVLPTRSSPVRPKAAVKALADPELAELLTRIDSGLEGANRAVTMAEQVQAGGFTRTVERFKKYVAGRDLKHRKAFLAFCLERGQASLDKATARRETLTTALDELIGGVTAFETMDDIRRERMQRNRDENVALWRELKAARPTVANARQAWTRAQGKSLTAIDEVLKRGQALLADWQAKHDAIQEQAGVTLAWLTPQSKVGQRLHGLGPWAEGVDPFEGEVVCKDKLADCYKVSGSSKGVEIDLCAEIDLTVVGLERRREAAQAL